MHKEPSCRLPAAFLGGRLSTDPCAASPIFPPTAAAKKAKRKDAYTYAETLPPAEDPTAAGARGITRGEFRTSIDLQGFALP